MLQPKPKSITFKQAFIITIGLHVLGFCGISAFSAYRKEKQKEYALAKQTYREQLMKKNSSSMFPEPGPLSVVAQSPFIVPATEQAQTSSFLGTTLDTIKDLALNAISSKMIEQPQPTTTLNNSPAVVNINKQNMHSSKSNNEITVSKTTPRRVLESADRFLDALKGVEFDLQSGPKTLQSPTIAHNPKSPATKAKELQEFKNATEDLKAQFIKAKNQITSEIYSQTSQTKMEMEETKRQFIQTQVRNNPTGEIIKEEIIRRVVDSRIVL
jgi:hypothetical protein